MKGLSLIIPAHNSEDVIEASIINYNNAFSDKFDNFEMIVVCNGCQDNTAGICRALIEKFPVRVIEIPQRGKGFALIRGFNEAKYDVMGFLDADNPFDLDKIIRMPDYLDESHVVIVSKYLRGTGRRQELVIRRLLSLGGSFVSRILFNMRFRDTQAGAKFFRKEVWERLNSHGNNFICTGFDWDIEFLYKTKKSNFRIAEIYIPFRPEEFSTVRLRFLPGMLKRLFMLKLSSFK